MGEIYKHTLNNKIYVGYTRYTSNFRLKQHINAALNGKPGHFYNAIRLYGSENIITEVLEHCPDTELQNQEKFWIKKLKANDPKIGYNKTDGGDGGPIRIGMKNSEEQRRKSSEAQKCKPKRNKGNCGKYIKSDEHKQKLSDSVNGRIWVSNVNTGLEHQIRKEDLQKYLDDGYMLGRKARDFSNDKRNVIISEEQKKKISESIEGRIHIHNEHESKMVSLEEFENNYQHQGYKRGRK